MLISFFGITWEVGKSIFIQIAPRYGIPWCGSGATSSLHRINLLFVLRGVDSDQFNNANDVQSAEFSGLDMRRGGAISSSSRSDHIG